MQTDHVEQCVECEDNFEWAELMDTDDGQVCSDCAAKLIAKSLGVE